MAHRKGAIWTERLLLGLILASLGATLNLLVVIHRQSTARTPLHFQDNLPAAFPPRCDHDAKPKIAQSASSSPNIDEHPVHAALQGLLNPLNSVYSEDPTEKARGFGERPRRRSKPGAGRSAQPGASGGVRVGHRGFAAMETAGDVGSSANRRTYGAGRELEAPRSRWMRNVMCWPTSAML